MDFLDPVQLADKVPQIGSDSFHGDGTAFSDAVNNTGAAFACSFRYLNNWASQYFVAMNEEQVSIGLGRGGLVMYCLGVLTSLSGVMCVWACP